MRSARCLVRTDHARRTLAHEPAPPATAGSRTGISIVATEPATPLDRLCPCQGGCAVLGSERAHHARCRRRCTSARWSPRLAMGDPQPAPIRVVQQRSRTATPGQIPLRLETAARRPISAKRRGQGWAQTGLFRKRNKLRSAAGRGETAASIAMSCSLELAVVPHGPRPLTSASCALRNLPVCAAP
jgi:hypothetical protein